MSPRPLPLHPPHCRLPQQLLPERQLGECFPEPYNVEATPYARIRDFSQSARRELLELKRKIELPAAKVVFVGDVAVGKTTLLSRFCYDQFATNYKATIGVDFEVETFSALGQSLTLEMWDTAGQERFKCIGQSYYRKANVIILIFDMSKAETLHSTKLWLKTALEVNSVKRPLVFLVGTKSDLLSKEEFVRMERLGKQMAYEVRAEYWSVSARSAYKVTKFFRRVAALTFEITFKDYMDTRNSLPEGTDSISEQMQKKSSIFDFGRREGSFCLC